MHLADPLHATGGTACFVWFWHGPPSLIWCAPHKHLPLSSCILKDGSASPCTSTAQHGSCDQWTGTCAMEKLKFSCLSILLQCSSPSFAELILHTWPAPDRYLRQDSDQLTHFEVANWLGVLFPELSSSAPGEKPLSMKEGDGSACRSMTSAPASALHQ